jgi:hypothetical protein
MILAIEALNNYLDRFDTSEENELRYKVAKYTAWNNDWEDARDHVTYPYWKTNLKILIINLLAGQIIVWTVDENEFPIAEEYLTNVLE